MSEYKRGEIFWVAYLGPHGKTIRESARTTDKRVAQRFERMRRKQVADGTWQSMSRGARVTLGEYAETWIQRQHDRKLKTAKDMETRMRLHVLPKLGARALEDVRPRDVISFVREVAAGELAPRSVHHVYDVLRSLMRDAQIDEVIVSSPCVLPPGTLPKKKDADPTWRIGALLTREELEILISDERVPLDRRTYYALIAFCGLRHGEAAGRRWRDYDPLSRPLGRLVVSTQYDDQPLKTEQPRLVPVHPTLAAILAEWRLTGFGSYLGRSPKPGDWIVPSRLGACRSVRHTHSKLQQDLERLGLRPRRTHDLRRTLITIARADGADKEVLRAITHGASSDVLDMYTSYPWETLCRAISGVRISRRGRSTSQSLHIEGTENESPLENQGAHWRSGRDSKPNR